MASNHKAHSMTDDIPNGTRVRKINASPGAIPAGSVGTVVEPIANHDGKIFAYRIAWDIAPNANVVTPAARIERITN